MFSSITNFVSSTIQTFQESVETYEETYKFRQDFVEIMRKYLLSFNSEKLKKNNVISCEIIENENKGDIESVKRIMKIDILNLSIPESVLYYFPEKTITLEHNIEINKKNKTITINIKNISLSQISFCEQSKIYVDKEVFFTIKATLSVNILFGVNETIKKLWYYRYKSQYDSFVKNIQEDSRLNLNSPAFSYLNNYTCNCYLNSDYTGMNTDWFEIVANPDLEGSFDCHLYSVEDYMKCLRNFNRFLGM